jgi:hypothetical protein
VVVEVEVTNAILQLYVWFLVFGFLVFWFFGFLVFVCGCLLVYFFIFLFVSVSLNCLPLTSLCRPNGTTFSASTSTCADSTRVGDVVTFSFTNFTKSGYPIDPILIKLRPDLVWESVLDETSVECASINSLHSLSLS